jgi:uncharacterized repeat protein (TIGR01451 family)
MKGWAVVKGYKKMKAGLFADIVRWAVTLLTPETTRLTGNARMATARQFLSVWLFMLLASPSAWGAPVIIPTPQPATTGLACVGTRAGSNLGCNAKEFTVGSTFSAAPGTPPFCVAGNSFDFLVDMELYGSNADRYDIGFYVGESYNAPDINDNTKTCSVTAFPMSPAPYANLDGINTCGDYIKAGDSIIRINKIKVKCQGDATGTLSVPFTLTYDQNGGNPSCDGSNPGTLPIPTTSKCQTGASPVAGTVKVFSGAYVDVKKLTLPAGDSQPFSFTATGPTAAPASTVIALTGSTTLSLPYPTDGTYTPPTIAAATDTTSVTLTDGQTARFYINALATSQTLTITETATANWETTAAITCSAVTGSPALTTNNATRTITAALNSTDTAAACTITNTKRSRITLTKSVGGRLDPADQFTVSASGGGTLTGTTSATTSGSGTSASTTFYSTPNTALTLTDAKASGPTALANYETRLTCTNAFTGPGATANASLPNELSTATTTFTPAPGDDITCTYTNTPKATLSKAFSTGTIGVGQAATLTYTITNPAGAPARTGGITFTDTFPANLVIAGTPNVVNSCGGTPTITAVAGTGAFTVGGTGVNAAVGASTCTISVNVTSATPLSGYVNGAAQITAFSDSLLNGVTSQTLGVVQGSLTKAFSPTTIDQGETSTLTFTLTNGAVNPAQSGINFTDTLPTNVTVAATPNITTTCPSGTGVITAQAGAGSIAVTGATMSSAMASCVITVDVTSNIPGGPYNNNNASISRTARVTNSVTTSGLTVQAKATVTIVKQSNGGTGSFSFSGGTNGLPASLTLDTGAANPKSSSAYLVTANSVETAITETIPANWALTSAGCTDGTSTFGALSGGTLTIPAANVAGKAITCTFTNTLLLPNLTVLKYAFGVTSGASAKPGQEIPYMISVSNTGPGTAGNVVVMDCLSPYSAWTLNTFTFADGVAPSGPSGLSLTGSTMYYSYDNGTTWTTTPPTNDGTGHAPAVACWKLVMDPAKSMNANPSSFTLNYQAKIK